MIIKMEELKELMELMHADVLSLHAKIDEVNSRLSKIEIKSQTLTNIVLNTDFAR